MDRLARSFLKIQNSLSIDFSVHLDLRGMKSGPVNLRIGLVAILEQKFVLTEQDLCSNKIL